MRIRKEIEIEEQLWLLGKDELPMPVNDFIEYCFRLYLRQETPSSTLFRKAVNLKSDLDKVTNKLYKLQTQTINIDNTTEYEEAMVTVYRIHDKLGYIGRNQLEKIGNQKDFNLMEWIKYVECKDDITITNFGALPK